MTTPYAENIDNFTSQIHEFEGVYYVANYGNGQFSRWDSGLGVTVFASGYTAAAAAYVTRGFASQEDALYEAGYRAPGSYPRYSIRQAEKDFDYYGESYTDYRDDVMVGGRVRRFVFRSIVQAQAFKRANWELHGDAFVVFDDALNRPVS